MSRARRCAAALAGFFGFGNFGDEMILASSIAMLESCGIPRSRLCVLSADPRGTARQFGVDSFDRWSFREARRAIASSETLLFPGGGLFQDATSVRSCVYYWALVRIASFSGTIFWALGQSIGPLGTRAGRYLARSALSRAKFLRARDERSAAFMRERSLDCGVMPDTVFGLEPMKVEQGEGAVLFNVRPGTSGGYVEAAIDAARMASRRGMELIGVAMSGEDEELLRYLADEKDLDLARIERPLDADMFAETARGACGAIGMRLHFAIFSTMCGLPAAVAPYDPKVDAFADEFGLMKLGGEDDENIEHWINIALTNHAIRAKKNVEVLRGAVRASFAEGIRAVGICPA